ncbi:hypothetical protein GXP67_28325 [Rhodocytophaga rosea]|uniref:Uncharacterized protein n=1 Tax=Rhodocytophaga rosea TaxID=2704465 RepID=A0A6C0GQE2_9BACT|nr:hypothetical protein [Rhodocytophaga rosea]QHT70279.1 hypothetical protein GXP67_28325 [Rhodocytophaga rosea]
MKVERYKIKGWTQEEQGLLIDENEEWVLVKHIPVDYVIDGYKLYRKQFIHKRLHLKKDAEIERVLKLKRIKEDKPIDFQFKSVVETLKWSEETYGLFEFQDQLQTELFYGKVNHIQNNLLVIDMIKANGKEEKAYDYEFELDEIRVITFETDYFESIRLLWQDQSKSKKRL